MNKDSNKFKTKTDKTQINQADSSDPLMTIDGTPYQITEEGSLGILAMGYVGIMLWRDKKYNQSVKPESINKKKEK